MRGKGGSTKKNICKGKLNEKISCTPINPKKCSCYGLKKNSCKEFDNEKKFLPLEISPPPPPNNFSNGLSLSATNARVEVFQLKFRRSDMKSVAFFYISGLKFNFGSIRKFLGLHTRPNPSYRAFGYCS